MSPSLDRSNALVADIRQLISEYRANDGVWDRARDHLARDILAYLDLIDIRIDQINEIDHREQLAWEQSMGDDL